MDHIINEYQKWKQQGEALRVQARQAMESRYQELLGEAVRIAQEYQADFGTQLKPLPPVTAFRFKPGKAKAKKKAGSAIKSSAPAQAPAPARAAAPKPDPKAAGIEKKLAAARKKLEAARAGGAATRNLEDRIYELEDELRLAVDKP